MSNRLQGTTAAIVSSRAYGGYGLPRTIVATLTAAQTLASNADNIVKFDQVVMAPDMFSYNKANGRFTNVSGMTITTLWMFTGKVNISNEYTESGIQGITNGAGQEYSVSNMVNIDGSSSNIVTSSIIVMYPNDYMAIKIYNTTATTVWGGGSGSGGTNPGSMLNVTVL